MHGLMLVNDLTGAEVGRVSRKLVALRATYEITLASGITAEVHQRFTGPFHPKWNFSVSGGEEMEMGGNFPGHDFTLTANGQTIATRVEGLDQPRRLVWGRHRRGPERPLILCGVLALEAEQDRAQERDRGEGPLGGLGGRRCCSAVAAVSSAIC